MDFRSHLLKTFSWLYKKIPAIRYIECESSPYGLPNFTGLTTNHE